MKLDNKDLLLYAVTDRSWLNGSTLYDQVESAIKGGVTFLQLREKNMDYESFLKEAKDIQELCRKYNIPFVVNDNVEIAAEIQADGVHIGQSDMGLSYARTKLGQDKIIGVSVQTVEQALIAQKCGADYLGVGAVFTTNSKDDADEVSHDTLKKICESVDIPVVAIGGISKDNLKELSGSGICGVALISAIFSNENIESATKQLRSHTESMLRNK